MLKIDIPNEHHYFSNQQLSFISLLNISKSFKSKSCITPFDTQLIFSNEAIWTGKFGGQTYNINFNELLPYHQNVQSFIKWILSSLGTRYSFAYIQGMFKSLHLFLNKEHRFTLDNCTKFLNELVLDKNKTETFYFYSFKRVVLFLIESCFPEFNYEDEYKLEFISRPSNKDDWKLYYDLDFKLKPDINRYIRNGLLKVASEKLKYSTEEMTALSALAIAYETGLRTIQMYRLTNDDLKIEGEFYSLSISKAKIRNKKRSKNLPYFIDLSYETGQILKFLIHTRNDQLEVDTCNNQLLRNDQGEISNQNDLISLINQGLKIIGGDNLPHLTPYDFRHNVGHSLAMAGASADEIALILGHSSTVVARHYISATPEIAFLKQKALGENRAYLDMMGMIMTGDIIEEDNCLSQKVAGNINNMVITGIGGCTASLCHFTPVRACYGCSDFNPFKDGNHNDVKAALQSEVKILMKLSDSTGQTSRNLLIQEHEQTIFEVDSVIALCNTGHKI